MLHFLLAGNLKYCLFPDLVSALLEQGCPRHQSCYWLMFNIVRFYVSFIHILKSFRKGQIPFSTCVIRLTVKHLLLWNQFKL